MPHKNLILAPHPDDEVFWCYSLLNEDSKVIIMTTNNRLAKSQSMLAEMGVESECYNFSDMHLNDRFFEVKNRLEEELSRGYTNLYYPAFSTHQDHQTVHRAVKIVTRPKNRVVRSLFEYPYWGDEQLVYNCVRAAPREKIAAMMEFEGTSEWFRYVCKLNEFVAARHCIPGLCEPFNLIWSDCL